MLTSKISARIASSSCHYGNAKRAFLNLSNNWYWLLIRRSEVVCNRVETSNISEQGYHACRLNESASIQEKLGRYKLQQTKSIPKTWHNSEESCPSTCSCRRCDQANLKLLLTVTESENLHRWKQNLRSRTAVTKTSWISSVPLEPEWHATSSYGPNHARGTVLPRRHLWF